MYVPTDVNEPDDGSRGSPGLIGSLAGKHLLYPFEPPIVCLEKGNGSAIGRSFRLAETTRQRCHGSDRADRILATTYPANLVTIPTVGEPDRPESEVELAESLFRICQCSPYPSLHGLWS